MISPTPQFPNGYLPSRSLISYVKYDRYKSDIGFLDENQTDLGSSIYSVQTLITKRLGIREPLLVVVEGFCIALRSRKDDRRGYA